MAKASPAEAALSSFAHTLIGITRAQKLTSRLSINKRLQDAAPRSNLMLFSVGKAMANAAAAVQLDAAPFIPAWLAEQRLAIGSAASFMLESKDISPKIIYIYGHLISVEITPNRMMGIHSFMNLIIECPEYRVGAEKFDSLQSLPLRPFGVVEGTYAEADTGVITPSCTIPIPIKSDVRNRMSHSRYMKLVTY